MPNAKIIHAGELDLLEDCIGGVAPHQYSFKAGDIEVLIEQSRILLKEEQIPGMGESFSEQDIMRGAFYRTMLSLIGRERGKEVGMLLDGAKKLYYLHAHGYSGKNWFFSFGDNGAEMAVSADQYLNRIIEKHGIDAAIITSCNEGGVRLNSKIPVIYSLNVSNVPEFSRLSILQMPNGKKVSDEKAMANLENFLDGLMSVCYEETINMPDVLKKISHWSRLNKLKEKYGLK